MHTPTPGDVYRHFKGNHYRVLTLAKHSETGEILVIYQALYDDHGVYARPLDMFTSEVDHEKYPDVTQKDRFELVKGLDLTVDINQFRFEQKAEPAAEKTEPMQAEPVAPVAEAPASVTSDPPSRTVNIKSSDELLEEFFDAETYRDRMNVLAAMHCMLTDSMVDTMAASLDTEIKNGDIEDRYYELRNYLATMERYECNRLR